MDHQDWQEVIIRKKVPKPANKNTQITQARQAGMEVESQKKCLIVSLIFVLKKLLATGGKNQNARTGQTAVKFIIIIFIYVLSIRKLEDDNSEDPLKLPTVTRQQAIAIQQARCAMKLTQVQLGKNMFLLMFGFYSSEN
jgi:hypothetical protein